MSQEKKEKMVLVKKSNKFWMGVVAASSLTVGALGGATFASGTQTTASQAAAGQANLKQKGMTNNQSNGQVEQAGFQNGMPPLDGQVRPDQGSTYGAGGCYGQNGEHPMPPQMGDQQGQGGSGNGIPPMNGQGGPSGQMGEPNGQGGQPGGSRQSKSKPSNADGTTKDSKTSSKNNTNF